MEFGFDVVVAYKCISFSRLIFMSTETEILKITRFGGAARVWGGKLPYISEESEGYSCPSRRLSSESFFRGPNRGKNAGLKKIISASTINYNQLNNTVLQNCI